MISARRQLTCLTLLFSSVLASDPVTIPGRWTEAKANDWYAKQAWPVGANYVPRNAINQLEMWQADTFDLKVIDQEFGWAAGIGLNVMRVYLHDLLWQEDSGGLLRRMDQFLRVADKHGIKILFVFFDGVWDPHPFPGKQRPPRPHVHNSGWLQSPGREILRDPAKHEALKPYVQGVLAHFKDDARIFGWDLFNEPDNPNPDAYRTLELPDKAEAALVLLQKSFRWAREINPSQPLTAGIWRDYQGYLDNPPIFRFMLANSDLISFHNYAAAEDVAREITALRKLNRPLICTEYLARGNASNFDPILGLFKEHKIGAINWGLVDGKSQTIYPWETWGKIYTGEPTLWHHDIFRADGTPYRKTETDYIRRLTTGKNN